MTSYELEELDHEIEECERYLAILQGMLNDPEKRKQLERRLFELKKERRREALLSWRNLPASWGIEVMNITRSWWPGSTNQKAMM